MKCINKLAKVLFNRINIKMLSFNNRNISDPTGKTPL